jgi:hypothetical protein
MGPNILFSALFSNTLKLCNSVWAGDQVPHPFKPQDTILVLYILIIKCVLDGLVSLVTRLRAGGPGFDSHEDRIFLFTTTLQYPDRL